MPNMNDTEAPDKVGLVTVKNAGRASFGFFDSHGDHVDVPPGGKVEKVEVHAGTALMIWRQSMAPGSKVTVEGVPSNLMTERDRQLIQAKQDELARLTAAEEQQIEQLKTKEPPDNEPPA